jgi:hypothetical protein
MQGAWGLDLRCTYACARRSLCIIDEFGKGTLSTDGVGLLCAMLRRFAAATPGPPPRLIACTHFSEVFNPAYLPRHGPPLLFHLQLPSEFVPLAFCAMNLCALQNL